MAARIRLTAAAGGGEDGVKALQIWGHRGCRGAEAPPENSLRAFAAAIAQGADGVELDVFLTRDRQLVVFHDETLERLSDGRGAISAATRAELHAVRLKAPTGELTEHGIPTLAEVLDLVEAWRREAADSARAQAFVVNIETKGRGIARHVAQEVSRRVEAGWRYANFLNSSFDLATLAEMRELLPELPVGALFEGPLGRPSAPWDLELEELRHCLRASAALRPDTVNVTLPSLCLPGAVELIRASGARPVAWTAGERPPRSLPAEEAQALMSFLLAQEIVLITDFPGEMRALERNYRFRAGR